MDKGDLTGYTERLRASKIAAVIGVLLLVVKFAAFRMTNSQAVLSDALESVVNVVSGLITIAVIIVSSKPADEDHPYGHGKIEYFSAAFEGGMITFAALAIFYTAIQFFLEKHSLGELELGLLLVAAAGVVNALLGIYLKRRGRQFHSIALVASGEHLISDFWTSLAVVLGLVLVRVTGKQWIDPLVAVVMATHLAITGVSLVRGSIGGLMDAEDRGLLKELAELFSKNVFPGIIRIHHTRIMRSGAYHHVDSHVVVPEFWSVEEAHEQTDRFESKVLSSYGRQGEMHMHLDPCRRLYCRVCDLADCPVRQQAFEKRIPTTLSELVSPVEPEEFRST